MFFEVAFSERAQSEIDEIEEYLAERFLPANAERFVERLKEACLSLGRMPHVGTKRDDLRPGIRTIGFERRITIYFVVIEKRVVILNVLHGGRDFKPSV